MKPRRDKIIEAIQANEAWMRLVYGHPWSDPEPPDVRAIEAEIVRLLRHEQPVPPFAQKWLVDWYSPRGDLGRGGGQSCYAEIQNRTETLRDRAQNRREGNQGREKRRRRDRRNSGGGASAAREEIMGVRKAIYAPG